MQTNAYARFGSSCGSSTSLNDGNDDQATHFTYRLVKCVQFFWRYHASIRPAPSSQRLQKYFIAGRETAIQHFFCVGNVIVAKNVGIGHE
jgi:hypothetical protein